jgi:hypothetical protein
MSTTGHRTAVIAHGIAIWAECQNVAGDKLAGSWPDRKWKDWANRFPQYVDFVKAEQFALFDRVNAQIFS